VDIFTNRVGLAYQQSRSMSSSARARKVGAILLIVVVAACGIAGGLDEQDRQSMASEFSPMLRKRVVSTWTASSIESPVVSEGGQIGAR